MLSALIFDVDGTLADTENSHRAAFNQAFAETGWDWVWDEATYQQLLDVAGGKERILHHWQQLRPDRRPRTAARLHDAVEHIHALKTTAYKRAVEDGQVPLRPGVMQLIEAAHHDGLRLAIATTTAAVNVVALLQTALGADWSRYFQIIEDASTAERKKPDPQAYLQALQRLQLPSSQCLAIEDSWNGLQAARQAGLATLITPNSFTVDHDFSGALRVLPDLRGSTVAHLRAWHTEST